MTAFNFSHGKNWASHRVTVGNDGVARWGNGSPLAPSIASQCGREGLLSAEAYRATERAYWEQQAELRRRHVESSVES